MAAVRHQSGAAAPWPVLGTLTSWEIGKSRPVPDWGRSVCRHSAAGTGATIMGVRSAGIHPLRPPAVRPDRMLRWKIRKKMIVGTAAMADAAMMRFSGVVVAPVIPTLIVSLVGV